MPLFSIVVPTRNRSRYLPWAIQSVLGQDFQDWEMVVSDNWSVDGTCKVVEKLTTERVRYVRTPRALSMPDSWEFAWRQARGDYILFLPDDDALVPGALPVLSGVIDRYSPGVIAWERAAYVYSTPPGDDTGNLLVMPLVSQEIRRIPSRPVLESMFSLRDGAPGPAVINAAFRRDVPPAPPARVFFGPYVDRAGAVTLLCSTKDHVFLDDVLTIMGFGPQSAGCSAMAHGGESLHRFVEEFPQRAVFTSTPLDAPVDSNFVAETFLLAKRQWPELLGSMPLDWRRYFARCYRELKEQAAAGEDVTRYLEQFGQVLAHRDLTFQRQVRGLLVGPGAWLRKSAPGRLLAKLREWSSVVVISGAEAGFSNILESARLTPELLARERREWRSRLLGRSHRRQRYVVGQRALGRVDELLKGGGS